MPKSLQLTIPVKLTIFFAFVFLIATLVTSQLKLNDLREEQVTLIEKSEAVQENIDALQNKLDMPFDDDYIIALAKSKLNYCLPDEIIFFNDLIN